MINTLRKFRHGLLEQGKTGQYLAYAVGEIILVVIGILIALQIDNWNENRKERLLEVKILRELNADLQSNLAEIQSINRTLLGQIGASDSLFADLDRGLPWTDRQKERLELIRDYNLPSIANTAFKYIESSGVGFLSNDSLRQTITWVYQTGFKSVEYRADIEAKMIEERVIPFLLKHFKVSKMGLSHKKLNYYWRGLNTPVELEALRKNEEFKAVLNELHGYREVRQHWIEIGIQLLEKVSKQVDAEIQRLSS